MKTTGFQNKLKSKHIHEILTCSVAQRTLATNTKPTNKRATVNPLANIFIFTVLVFEYHLIYCVIRFKTIASLLFFVCVWTGYEHKWD